MNETKTTPKDFFLNLGVIVTLYFSVVSLLNLIFSIINKFFPDALSYSYDGGSYTARWTISSLIILYPLYVYLSHLVNKDIARFPEKKNIWIKKWSTYLTLFLTGAAIATDLIILINTFLNGEITARFILKVLAVLIIAAFIFAYYLYDLKKVEGQGNGMVKTLAIIASLIVILTIIGGFFTAGSPFTERQRRFDDQRISDLSTIQNQITNYWQKKGALPQNLSQLNDPLSYYTVPKDPETQSDYEYKISGNNVFELCANFSLASDVNNKTRPIYSPYDQNQSFEHPAGKKCFERNIDSALYPVTPNGIPTPVKGI